jgi:hypothetical protein
MQAHHEASSSVSSPARGVKRAILLIACDANTWHNPNRLERVTLSRFLGTLFAERELALRIPRRFRRVSVEKIRFD